MGSELGVHANFCWRFKPWPVGADICRCVGNFLAFKFGGAYEGRSELRVVYRRHVCVCYFAWAIKESALSTLCEFDEVIKYEQ